METNQFLIPYKVHWKTRIAIFEPSFQETFGSQFRLNFRRDRRSVAFFGLRFSLPRLIKRSRAPDRAIEKSRKSPLSFPPSFHAAFVPPVKAIKRTRRRRLYTARSGGKEKGKEKVDIFRLISLVADCSSQSKDSPKLSARPEHSAIVGFSGKKSGRSNKVCPSLLRGVEIPFFLLSFFHYPKGGLRKRQGKKRTGGKRAVVTFG